MPVGTRRVLSSTAPSPASARRRGASHRGRGPRSGDRLQRGAPMTRPDAVLCDDGRGSWCSRSAASSPMTPDSAPDESLGAVGPMCTTRRTADDDHQASVRSPRGPGCRPPGRRPRRSSRSARSSGSRPSNSGTRRRSSIVSRSPSVRPFAASRPFRPARQASHPHIISQTAHDGTGIRRTRFRPAANERALDVPRQRRPSAPSPGPEPPDCRWSDRRRRHRPRACRGRRARRGLLTMAASRSGWRYR